MRAVPHQPSGARYPLLALACVFACGILAAQFAASHTLKIWLTGGSMLFLVTVLCLARKRNFIATLLVAAAFFCAGVTLALVEKESAGNNRLARLYQTGAVASGDPVELTGVLQRAPEPAADAFYLSLQIEKISLKGQEQTTRGFVQLIAPVADQEMRRAYEALDLHYGARLRVMVALRREESFRNPGVNSFIEYLSRRGFDAVGTIKSPLLIERLDDQPVLLPLALLYEWRLRLLGKIGKEFSLETAGLMEAALLGNRNLISQSAAERFRAGGTFHVLVISGLHISFIGLLALWFARRLMARRASQFAMTVLFLWAYALAVGAEASVVRAALMFTLIALAPVLHRRIETFNALGGAGLALLILHPADLFDPSFQLTFLSVLSIAAIAWPLIEKLKTVGAWRPTRATPYPPLCTQWMRTLGEALFWSERDWQREMERTNFRCKLFKTRWAILLERWRVQRVLRYTSGAMIVSASVQIGMLPFLVLYFHRVSFASLILNTFVALLMAVESLFALAAVSVSQLSELLSAPLIAITEKLNWLMVHSVDPFANAHVAFMRVPEYTGLAAGIYGVYYVPLGFLIFLLARWNPLGRVDAKEQSQARTRRHTKQYLIAAAFFCVLVLIMAHPLSNSRANGKLRVDFLDVGQGDAALVTMPDGTTLLIDAGGRPRIDARRRSSDEDDTDETFVRDARSVGEAVVSEYLWWRGLDQIDYLLATHADADHINGFNDIARNFKVRAALVARAPAKNAEYARFASSMQEYGVPVQLIGRGDVLRFGHVTAETLWPVPNASTEAATTNDDSIVLRLRFGERVFLLTGDIEKNAEVALLGSAEDVHCDVIKVAHHGSRTSSTQEFVAATHPALAVISVGLTSPFGHPDQNVVERWRTSGAKVLTTGKSGTITISTNGQSLSVEKFVER